MTDPLDRIAAALDRIAPPAPTPADPLAHPAYVWRGTALAAARDFAPLPLDRLRGIDEQKAALVANLERLAAGAAAHDVLLSAEVIKKPVNLAAAFDASFLQSIPQADRLA